MVEPHDERPRVGADDDRYFDELARDHHRDWEERYDLSRPLYIRLRPPQYWELQRQARAQHLRAWELALAWVEERLADPSSSARAPRDGTVRGLDERLSLVEARLAELSAEVAWGTHVAAGSRSTTPARQEQRPASEPQRSATGALPLHEEILLLLSQRGPMSVRDIVAALQAKGVRTRDGEPVTQAIVSGRIAHKRYRDLFERRGRLIAPAASSPSHTRSTSSSLR